MLPLNLVDDLTPHSRVPSGLEKHGVVSVNHVQRCRSIASAKRAEQIVYRIAIMNEPKSEEQAIPSHGEDTLDH